MNMKELTNISPEAKIKHILSSLLLPIIAIMVGLLSGGIAAAIAGKNPFQAILGLLQGGYGSAYLLTTTLTRATPIIFAGISAALVWGSGYDSMGGAGQLTAGALVTAIIAPIIPGPPILVIIVSLLAGAAAGMLFSCIITFLKVKFDASLLIVSLMMNYVAQYLSTYFTTYFFKDPYAADSSAIQTQELTATLPKLSEKYSLHLGFAMAILLVILIWFMMNRTTFGYRARMGGLNPNFADYGGINSKKMIWSVLSLSGAIAGLGGAIEVLGTKGRYVDLMMISPGYNWSGITASIMSGYHPAGTMISSVFLAGLNTGGSFIERNMGVPSEVSAIIQGVITMLVTVKLVISFRKKRKKGGAPK